MQSVRQVARLNDLELEKVVPSNASWHTDYRDTAYIYIGGLPFELSEGDVLTIFSQYGNPVHINLVRDKETGKSRGFCFLKYEDQRSCDLAVDNLSGAGVMGRVISVDHTRYKKKEGEVEGIGEEAEDDEADVTDREEGEDRTKRRRTDSVSEDERPMLKEEIELARLLREHDDDDPMKEYLVQEKKAEVEEARKAVVKAKPREKERHRHHHRSRRHDDEDGERRYGHRSRRDRDDENDEERRRRKHRSDRTRSVEPERSDDEHVRRRHRSRRDGADREDDKRKSRRDDDRRRKSRSPADRSRSRERDRREK
ncbi:Hypothetical protein R9X50_00420700 [Acrodontium crateriforme]|uniref:RRM domain-containing protein n=1 Tax=Acrodontium crateriforme TaxID=150365 RepID=A0AAQ3RAJ8_9PEZI|nr:Hypothetical protein R9X50_00420700 [Acrodontium crateriforme]